MVESEIRKFLWENRIPNPINLTFTEKQVFNRFEIDEIKSERNFKHFKNVLNTKVYGNGYKRFKKQLSMLIVREISKDGRHHLHGIVEHPSRYDFETFKSMIIQIWSSTHFGYDQIHIEKPKTIQRTDGWLGYILKNQTKSKFSSSQVLKFSSSQVLKFSSSQVLKFSSSQVLKFSSSQVLKFSSSIDWTNTHFNPIL